jgi:hypothetical protein
VCVCGGGGKYILWLSLAQQHKKKLLVMSKMHCDRISRNKILEFCNEKPVFKLFSMGVMYIPPLGISDGFNT